jgi:hypothetical protein
MGAKYSCETSVYFQNTAWRYIQEETTLDIIHDYNISPYLLLARELKNS